MLLALAMAPLLIGATPIDWTKTVNRTAAGAFVVGNPKAPVKLVEYVSYTCGHCAEFVAESEPVLKDKFVRSGSTRIELRHAIRDKIDLAAAVVARCTRSRFGATSDAIFAAQGEWFERATRFERSSASSLALYTENVRLRAIADRSGLSDIGRANGLTDAALDACFADTDELLLIATMSDAAWKAIAAAAAPEPGGTPSFVVNGKPYASHTWPMLEKTLRAAGAK